MLPGCLAQLPDPPRGHQRLGVVLARRGGRPIARSSLVGRSGSSAGAWRRRSRCSTPAARRVLRVTRRRRGGLPGSAGGAAAARDGSGTSWNQPSRTARAGWPSAAASAAKASARSTASSSARSLHRGGAVLGRQPRRHLAQSLRTGHRVRSVRSAGRVPRRARPGGSPPRTRRRHTSWRPTPALEPDRAVEAPDASCAPLQGETVASPARFNTSAGGYRIFPL